MMRMGRGGHTRARYSMGLAAAGSDVRDDEHTTAVLQAHKKYTLEAPTHGMEGVALAGTLVPTLYLRTLAKDPQPCTQGLPRSRAASLGMVQSHQGCTWPTSPGYPPSFGFLPYINQSSEQTRPMHQQTGMGGGRGRGRRRGRGRGGGGGRRTVARAIGRQAAPRCHGVCASRAAVLTSLHCIHWRCTACTLHTPA